MPILAELLRLPAFDLSRVLKVFSVRTPPIAGPTPPRGPRFGHLGGPLAAIGLVLTGREEAHGIVAVFPHHGSFGAIVGELWIMPAVSLAGVIALSLCLAATIVALIAVIWAIINRWRGPPKD
jgi:hypothetical protein